MLDRVFRQTQGERVDRDADALHRDADRVRGRFPPPSPRGEYNLTMENFLIFVLFLVVWFLVLPRIPGISRFT